MKTFSKQLKMVIALAIGVVFFMSTTTPGFDENGQDINECEQEGTCPYGYECWNIPGSYLCVGEGGNFELKESSTPGSSLLYFVTGTCIGSEGICEAECSHCHRIYYAIMGKAFNVSGICVCGETNFSAL